MRNHFLKLLFICCLSGSLGLISCEDELGTTDVENFGGATAANSDAIRPGGPNGRGGQRGGERCVQLIFPVTFTFSDGSSITAESAAEARTAFQTYREANPEVRERPEISFPVDVTNSDGETVTVNSSEELDALKEGCSDGISGNHGHRALCFEFVFPVTFTFSDGSSVTAENKEELHAAIQAYREANPDIRERPEISFPVDVTTTDGEVVTLNSSDEFEALRQDCPSRRGGHHGDRGGNRGGEPCFELVYPVTFTFSDGSSITAGSKEEAKEAFQAYHEANPDVRERPEISFPVDVITTDGEEVTVNSSEEFRALKEDCREG